MLWNGPVALTSSYHSYFHGLTKLRARELLRLHVELGQTFSDSVADRRPVG
jgi:hypothetical protein